MTNLAKTFLATLLLTVIFGFADKKDSAFTGTYGVSVEDPSQIELIINPDKTFSFQDFSNPDDKINVSGKWESNKNTIILNSDQPDSHFHDKWRIIIDGQVAKSRKGMTFYSLFRK